MPAAQISADPGGAVLNAMPNTIGSLLVRRSALTAWTAGGASTYLRCRAARSKAAGDVDTLLLDKDRHHHPRHRQRRVRPSAASPIRALRCGAASSLADEPEGRSIVVLAKEKYGIRSRDMANLPPPSPVYGADPHDGSTPWVGSRVRVESARARSMPS